MPHVIFPVQTERLLLRPFDDGDLDALHAMQSREDVTRYLYWGPRTLDEVRVQLERLKRMTLIEDGSDALRLAAVVRESDVLIGDVSLHSVNREHLQAELGFIVHPDYHGQGYATEATAEMLRIGFEDLGLHRIYGSCDARNAASARVMERLGMRREAHFRETEFVKGEWCDEFVYAILATEWAASR
ncbi:MAG: GNAT family protein [Chloroflexota bacterium]